MTICNVLQFVFFIAVMSTTSDVRGCPNGCRLSLQYDCHAWSGNKDPAYVQLLPVTLIVTAVMLTITQSSCKLHPS